MSDDQRVFVGIDPARHAGDTEAMVTATRLDDGTLRIDSVVYLDDMDRDAIEMSRWFGRIARYEP